MAIDKNTRDILETGQILASIPRYVVYIEILFKLDIYSQLP